MILLIKEIEKMINNSIYGISLMINLKHWIISKLYKPN